MAEKERFLEALEAFGKDYSKIARYMATREYTAVVRYGTRLTRKLKCGDSDMMGAHLLPILESRRPKDTINATIQPKRLIEKESEGIVAIGVGKSLAKRTQGWTDEESKTFIVALDKLGAEKPRQGWEDIRTNYLP